MLQSTCLIHKLTFLSNTLLLSLPPSPPSSQQYSQEDNEVEEGPEQVNDSLHRPPRLALGHLA